MGDGFHLYLDDVRRLVHVNEVIDCGDRGVAGLSISKNCRAQEAAWAVEDACIKRFGVWQHRFAAIDEVIAVVTPGLITTTTEDRARASAISRLQHGGNETRPE